MTSVLAFDTSGPWCSVAVAQNGIVLAHESQYLPRAHSSKLLPLIHKTLLASGLTMKEIDQVAVIRGPGSFTGLRVGLATAQGLSFALNIPLIGIDAFKAYAASVQTSDNILVVLDTQKEDVYCQLLSAQAFPIKESIALHPNQVADYAGDELYTLVGDGCSRIIPLLDELEQPYEYKDINPDEVCQSLALLAFQTENSADYTEDPLYIHPVKVTKPNK